MTTVHLLQSHPHVAESYRRRFRHVLVDEYQDTNHAQYTLIKELVGRRRAASSTPAELCVVGDADQSIYAFRGATIRNILEFERDYPDARTILLEQNYRSTQTILNAANAVIDRNTVPQAQAAVERARAPASRSSATSPTPSTPRPTGWPARSTGSPTTRLTRPGDVAVFYRTNAQSRVFEEVFIRVGLPYKVVGGVRFYERKEVRDALAYLRAIVNDDDTVSIRRVLNTPRRGIGDRAEACVEALSARDRISFGAGAAPGRRRAGHLHPGGQRDRRLRRAARRACASWPRPRRRRRCWRRCCTRSGYLGRAGGEPRPAGRRAGWRTCRSW